MKQELLALIESLRGNLYQGFLGEAYYEGQNEARQEVANELQEILDRATQTE